MRNGWAIKIILVVFFIWNLIGIKCHALPLGYGQSSNQPIIVLTIDKVDCYELFKCELPSLKKFLSESACGMMNIRTGAGYYNTESGFLSLGSGNRGFAIPVKGGAYQPQEIIGRKNASSILEWSTGKEFQAFNLIIPEIGWIHNRAKEENYLIQPGLLGEIFRSNGWRTYLLGDQDTIIETSRPGGYIMMDREGIIDGGLVGSTINKIDQAFPYRHRFNTGKILTKINKLLKPGSLILVDFGDFARLDQFREEMLPEQYLKLKQEAWDSLEYFMDRVVHQLSGMEYRMLLLSPSISGEKTSSMLAPLVIKGNGYSSGLLTSGTTNWNGLVANIDLLPTLINMANLPVDHDFSGRVARSVPTRNHLKKLSSLNYKINMINNSQRSLLDWYLWVISIGWVATALSILLKKRLANGSILIAVAVMPLVMFILPLLPAVFWMEGSMLLITLALIPLVMKFNSTDQRFLIISIFLWGGIIFDQFTGWNLIRFSALGYSAVGGSRYYGIGNEFMGVFLAVSLVLSHLTKEIFKCKWPALVILGLSTLTLGWPQLGINFGGTLAAVVGFSYYAGKLYSINWGSRKTWLAFSFFIIIVASMGWWDSLREPNLQTHLGRFIKLLIEFNLSQTWQIFYRKAVMNMKLFVFSSWTRIILLALIISCLIKLAKKIRVVNSDQRIVCYGILISGLAAFLVNDSGVVACGTCLAYGFTYLLSNLDERIFSSD
jgi:hypothetical protein